MTSSHITADLLDLNGNPITSTSHLVLRRTGSGKLVPAESAPHSLRRVGGITNNGWPVPSARRIHQSPRLTEGGSCSDHAHIGSVRSVDSSKAASRASPSASPHHKHANVDTSQQLDSPHTRDFHAGQTPYLYPWQRPQSPFYHAISPPDTTTTLSTPETRTEDTPAIPLPATARVKVMSSPARKVEVAEPVKGVRERMAVLEQDEATMRFSKGKDGAGEGSGDRVEQCDVWCEVAEWI